MRMHAPKSSWFLAHDGRFIFAADPPFRLAFPCSDACTCAVTTMSETNWSYGAKGWAEGRYVAVRVVDVDRRGDESARWYVVDRARELRVRFVAVGEQGRREACWLAGLLNSLEAEDAIAER
jgi:hypothetical protein